MGHIVLCLPKNVQAMLDRKSIIKTVTHLQNVLNIYTQQQMAHGIDHLINYALKISVVVLYSSSGVN